jgi:NAD(P)H-dependent FMN reductase
MNGLVLSARLGNSFDFAEFLLPEREIRCLADSSIRPCSGCAYECLQGDACPIQDDVGRVHAELGRADGLIVFSPVYDGRPPALFFALEERLPAMWRREAAGFRLLEGKAAGIVVVGNIGTRKTLRILREWLEGLSARVVAEVVVVPRRQELGGGVRGGLLANESVRADLEELRSRVLDA